MRRPDVITVYTARIEVCGSDHLIANWQPHHLVQKSIRDQVIAPTSMTNTGNNR